MMSITRRGFFGGLLGLFGLGVAARTTEIKSDTADEKAKLYLRVHDPVLRQKCMEILERKLDKVGYWGLAEPNNDDTWSDLKECAVDQMIMTGRCLVWTVPNKLGEICEVYLIPTSLATPQPTVLPDYPDGYYRILPLYPYGPFAPDQIAGTGAPIAAQWMFQVKTPGSVHRYDGYSPMAALRLHIDEAEEIDRSRWIAWRRSFTVSA